MANPTAAAIAPGVIREGGLNYDFYEGTKSALIAAGVCKAEWFPAAPVLFNRLGKIKRAFNIVDGDTEVRLRDHHERGCWSVSISVSPEECAKRSAKFEEESREREEESRRLAQADFSEKLAQRLAALPPFLPGSMSKGEIHSMRIFRALNGADRDFIVVMAESLLVKHVDAAEPSRKLRLVVDNDNGAHTIKAPAI